MKSNLIATALIFLLATLFVCCSKEAVSEDELKAYIQDESNYLSKTAKTDGYQVNVSYKPQELLVKQEMDAGGANLSALQEKYGQHIYFILSLSKDNHEVLDKGAETYSDLVSTLSFRMSEFVSLTTSGKDTLHAVDYVFSRTYGYSGANNLMFAFAKEKITKSKWIEFNLEEFGLGLGRKSFRFEMDDMENIPRLSILQHINQNETTITNLN